MAPTMFARPAPPQAHAPAPNPVQNPVQDPVRDHQLQDRSVLLSFGGNAAPAVLAVDDALLSAVASIPLLTAEEEVMLARTAEAGALAEQAIAAGTAGYNRAELAELAREGAAAFSRLVLSNVRLVSWSARRYETARCRGRVSTNLSHLDLVHEGMFGLVRAAHKWDYMLGVKFSTYAVRWIRAMQGRAIQRASGIPVAVTEQQHAIRRAREQLTGELNRTPSDREVSARVGLSVARMHELESYAQQRSFDDYLAGTDGVSLGEVTADVTALDPLSAVENRERNEALAQMVDRLPARHRAVLTLHFGLDGEPARSVEEIADQCAVSVRRAHLTLDQALAELRADPTLTSLR